MNVVHFILIQILNKFNILHPHYFLEEIFLQKIFLLHIINLKNQKQLNLQIGVQ